jgi:hypothetical protein
MKKIKSLKHLQKEKKRLRFKQLELEDQLQDNWDEFKVCLQPVSIVKDIFKTAISAKPDEGLNIRSIIKNTFIFGASLLVKKFADKMEEKFSKDII